MSSARVETEGTTQEEDLLRRSTKKVKTRTDNGGEVAGKEIVMVESVPSLPSYKERLMHAAGDENQDEEWLKELDNLEMPEDKWYRDEEDMPTHDEGELDPCPVIPVSRKEYEDWCQNWKQSLIVNVLGKKVGFKILENRLKRDWARAGSINIIDMPQDYYLVNFSDLSDYKRVLFEGPWLVADHYLLIQRWRPFFLENAEVIKKVAVWIRIPRLPIELYTDKFLWRVGAKLGSMLKIDQLTSFQARGQFARICVEIDLTKKLVSKIEVLGHVLKLEYEGLHSICFHCGRFGHKLNQCSERRSTAEEQNGGESATGPGMAAYGGDPPAAGRRPDVRDIDGGGRENHEGEENPPVNHGDQGGADSMQYGPWMIVRRPNRRSRPKINIWKANNGEV